MRTPLSIAREARSITSAEVARSIGCDKSHYGRVEKGEVKPSPELAAKIAAFFGHVVTEMQILYPERYVTQNEAA